MGTSSSQAPDVSAWRHIEVVGPLAGGARNRVYRARLMGADVVIRASGRSNEALEWELDLLDFLATEGLIVPRIIETDDGRRHDNGVLVQEFIPGGAPRNSSDWKRIVGVLEQVHESTRGWPQRPGFASTRMLMDRDRGGDVDLHALPDKAAQLVRDAWAPVVELPECAVHGDPGAGNVVLTDEYVGLIDWDEARVDSPAFDFADVPDDVDIPVRFPQRERVVNAGIAWETAACWTAEPAYARKRLAELQAFPPSSPRDEP